MLASLTSFFRIPKTHLYISMWDLFRHLIKKKIQRDETQIVDSFHLHSTGNSNKKAKKCKYPNMYRYTSNLNN